MQSNSMNLFGDAPTKRCKGCKEVKPLSEFHFIRNGNGKRYPYSYCKPCGLKNRRDWYKKPGGTELLRARNLRVMYGITTAEYDAMLKEQGDVCAICQRPERRLNRKRQVRTLAVDHDHSTGRIRGLLCSSCNNGIGYFGDDLQLLQAAVIYLERFA